MVKLTGPMMSIGARGQFGKSVVTAKWRGIAYARQYVKPANPQTTAQMANRTRFALLREMYKLAPALIRLPWEAFTQGRPFLPVNKFVGENNRLLNGEADFANAIMSPGARGGLPPVAVVATDGVAAGSIDVAVTVPDVLPDGWTVSRVIAVAHEEQDPTGLFTGPFKAGEDLAAPYTVNLTGFTAGKTLRAYGFVEYQKPDGKLAYSVSLNDDVVVA